MEIPRYWAYAEDSYGNPSETYYYWRSSSLSVDDAREKADLARDRARRWIRKEVPEDDLFAYPYGVLPREELIEEIRDENRHTYAFLSRNGVGARVLNVENILFLDWDIAGRFRGTGRPSFFVRLFRWLASLFRGDDKLSAFDETFHDESPEWLKEIPLLKPLADFHRRHRDWNIRVYQTAAGYRGIVTHRHFDPMEGDVMRVMEETDCDEMYRLLCRKQKSFRARLTPKGTRLELWPRPLPWNFRFKYPVRPDDPNAQGEYDRAVEIYETRQRNFATCRYLGTLGDGTIADGIAPIVELHDRITRIDSDLPLA